MDTYSILSDQGELSTLEGFVQKDKFDLTTYTPAVIDFLTDDQNQLYGLSAAFTGKALYYNKKLFDQNSVAYPNDQVTWDDVFELAQRFPGEEGQEDRQTGLYYKSISTPFMMALTIGESSGLSFYNQNTFTLSSPSWEKIFDGVTKCFKNQVCYDGSQSVSSNSTVVSEMEKQTYPFLVGNIAMAIDESTMLQTLMKNKNADNQFEWGVVPFPASPENPGMGNGIYMNTIFSIPKNSNKVEQAWELIKYIASNDYGKILPQINVTELPARVIGEEQDENIAAFYKLTRVNNTLINQFRELPLPLISKLDEIAPTYMSDIVASDISVQDALKAFEEELNASLRQVDAK